MSTNPRLQRLAELKQHVMYAKLFKKLTKAEEQDLVFTLINTRELTRDEFASYVNKWGLDTKRSKNYSDAWAILSAIASS